MITYNGITSISVPDPRDPRADFQEIPMNHHDQDIKGT